MKYLLIVVIFGLSLFANEMQRIESIVTDIEKLRADYNRCKLELNINSEAKSQLNQQTKQTRKYKKLFDKERFKNTLLTAKLEELKRKNGFKNTNSKTNVKSNKKLLKLLITKEAECKKLQTRYNQDIQIAEQQIKSLKNQLKSSKTTSCDDKFPKLIMRDGIEKQKEVEETFKAATFRLKNNADIYNLIDGEIVEQWDIKTSFTSSIMTQNWMKITGYFVNKKWQKATRELWIKKSEIVKR